LNEKARRRVDEAEKGKRNLAEESYISMGAAPVNTESQEAAAQEASSTNQMDSDDAKDVELPVDRPQKQVAAIKKYSSKNQPKANSVELNAV
jgi:hypothetical protein